MASQEDVLEKALSTEEVKRHITGDIKKVIYVPGRILNLIV